MRTLSYAEAISEGTVQAMERDPSVFIAGIAVDHSSGIFGTTYGGRAGTVPIVIRAVVGRGWGQGATHSQSLQAPLAHFPGLTVLMPSSPRDAKGLMMAALQHDGPVVILEHRSLFGLKGEVPEAPFVVPIGKANVVRTGTDVTVASTSFMTVEARRAAEELAKEGVSLEVIDLRSIRPLDEATILASVKKTGRLIVTDTSWEMCGVVSEIAALAAEKAFYSLKAPVRRIALPNCPAPDSQALEQAFYPKASTIAKAALVMLGRTSSGLGQIDLVDDFKGPY